MWSHGSTQTPFLYLQVQQKREAAFNLDVVGEFGRAWQLFKMAVEAVREPPRTDPRPFSCEFAIRINLI
jgi:hypothetical protein